MKMSFDGKMKSSIFIPETTDKQRKYSRESHLTEESFGMETADPKQNRPPEDYNPMESKGPVNEGVPNSQIAESNVTR